MWNLKLALTSICLGFIFCAGLSGPAKADTAACTKATCSPACQAAYKTCYTLDPVSKMKPGACYAGQKACLEVCAKCPT